MPTKRDVKDAIKEVDTLDLPDGAYWALIHERLGLEYGVVFDFIAADPAYFGWEKTKGDREHATD